MSDANLALLQELGIDKVEIINRVIEIIADKVSSDIEYDFKKSIKQKSEQIVEKRIGEIVDEATTKAFQPITVWGEKKGEPTTIRDMLENNVQNWWSAKVDNSGNPSTSYGGTPRAEWQAQKIVREVVTKEMQNELNAVIADAKVQLSKAMSDKLTEYLKKWR